MDRRSATIRLESDHLQMTASLARLVDFAEASDRELLREEWDALEPRVLVHLDAEEMFLLPGFEKAHPADAARVRDQHAQIRTQLGAIGIAVDLHLLRADMVTDFRDLLLEHVAEERRGLYPWAHTSADEHSLRMLLERLERGALRRVREDARRQAHDPAS
jgi:Hemerythrin HHE cation binding domain